MSVAGPRDWTDAVSGRTKHAFVKKGDRVARILHTGSDYRTDDGELRVGTVLHIEPSRVGTIAAVLLDRSVDIERPVLVTHVWSLRPLVDEQSQNGEA